MLLRALLASLLLLLPVAATASPVSLELFGDDEGAVTEPSTLSMTGGSCTGAGGRDSCGGGYSAGISGSLSADLDGDLLSNLSGDIEIAGIGTITVSDGLIDFSGGAESFLETDYGTFHFGGYGSSGSQFWVWGGNWGSQCNSWLGCKRFRLRFRGDIKPITQVPEPSAALLFGLGAVVVSRRVTRRR